MGVLPSQAAAVLWLFCQGCSREEALLGWLGVRSAVPHRSRLQLRQLLLPLPLCLLPGSCLVSPSSKLLLSHLLEVFPAVTVHISLCSLPPPEIPRWLSVVLAEEEQWLRLRKALAAPAWLGWWVCEAGLGVVQPGWCHRAGE